MRPRRRSQRRAGTAWHRREACLRAPTTHSESTAKAAATESGTCPLVYSRQRARVKSVHAVTAGAHSPAVGCRACVARIEAGAVDDPLPRVAAEHRKLAVACGDAVRRCSLGAHARIG